MSALAVGTSAHAGIEPCGNIELEPRSECEVLVVEAGCMDNCTPTFFEAACAPVLYGECYGQCRSPVDEACEASCEGPCMDVCAFAPGAMDCMATCDAHCEIGCAQTCAGDDTSCWAACETTCAGSCEGTCGTVTDEVGCAGECAAVCAGSCDAQSNLDCQLDCQADGFFTCADTMERDCEQQCQRDEGALFCDGQYVDNVDDLDVCVEALRVELGVEIEGYPYPELDEEDPLDDDSDEAVSCSTTGRGPAGATALLGLLVLLTARRRR